MEHSAPTPLAQWNPTRDCWETTHQGSLLSEHLDVYSETWPTSVSMRRSVAYERPTWEPATSDSASSSSPGDETLPTPTVRDYKDNAIRREPHRPDATDTLSLALADLIGLDTVLAILEAFYDGFNDSKYRPAPLLKEMVAAGYLGRKTGRGFHAYA